MEVTMFIGRGAVLYLRLGPGRRSADRDRGLGRLRVTHQRERNPDSQRLRETETLDAPRVRAELFPHANSAKARIEPSQIFADVAQTLLVGTIEIWLSRRSRARVKP